jgi:hypothetical protein
MKIQEVTESIWMDRMALFSDTLGQLREMVGETMSMAGYAFHHGARQGEAHLYALYCSDNYKVKIDWNLEPGNSTLDVILNRKGMNKEHEFVASTTIADTDEIQSLEHWILKHEKSEH